MKTRQGFVSNSSSSSFIFLCFTEGDFEAKPSGEPEYYNCHNNRIRSLDDNDFDLRYGYVLERMDDDEWKKVLLTSEELARHMRAATDAFTRCGWEIKEGATPLVYFSKEST